MTARRLVLLRHSKAEQLTTPAISDEDRPLSSRGRADARAAGAWLATRQLPELVLCSPARRTRQTWQAVATRLPADAGPQVRYEPGLYQGGVAELLALLRDIEESVRCVLVVGHNPTLSQLAFTLDPQGELDSDGLRTSGLAVHECPGDWAGCGAGRAPLVAAHTARAG